MAHILDVQGKSGLHPPIGVAPLKSVAIFPQGRRQIVRVNLWQSIHKLVRLDTSEEQQVSVRVSQLWHRLFDESLPEWEPELVNQVEEKSRDDNG